MKRLMLLLVAGVFITAAAFSAYGTPKIADNTGKKCKECHGKSDNGQGGGGPHEKGPGGNRNK